MQKVKKHLNPWVLGAGVATGAAAVALTALGNPANMGFCVACFLRDIAGSLHLHSAAQVQYFRPEIVGLILGALVMALIRGEFRPRAGSSPAARFLIGMFVMIGALVFLGCPLRMVIRMGGGDLNAFVGLAGFALGILAGIFFLKRGFTLRRSYPVGKTEGSVLPAVLAALLVLALAVPALFAFSEAGPGSKRAPVLASLLIAGVVGALAQKSRLCMVGGMRDAFLFRDFTLLLGFAAIFVTVLAGNLLTGNFSGFSAYLQPIAHSSQLWNLLGMSLAGWGSVLLGGCPLRQLILTGEGNSDSAVTVLGMAAGAAFAHNFSLAGASASMTEGVYSAGGVSVNGKIAVVCGLAVMLAISLLNTEALKKGTK